MHFITLFCMGMLFATQSYTMEQQEEALMQKLFRSIVAHDHQSTWHLIQEYPYLVDTYGQSSREGCYGKMTALHVASHSGNDTALVLLLGISKKSVNAETYREETPLHFVSNKTVTEILVKNGAAVDHQEDDGRTPLWEALFPFHSNEPRFDVAECLLDNGANINHPRVRSRDTLLHKAAEKNERESIAEFLLKNGADQSMQDKYGRTPLDVAIEGGRKVELFRAYEGTRK